MIKREELVNVLRDVDCDKCPYIEECDDNMDVVCPIDLEAADMLANDKRHVEELQAAIDDLRKQLEVKQYG